MSEEQVATDAQETPVPEAAVEAPPPEPAEEPKSLDTLYLDFVVADVEYRRMFDAYTGRAFELVESIIQREADYRLAHARRVCFPESQGGNGGSRQQQRPDFEGRYTKAKDELAAVRQKVQDALNAFYRKRNEDGASANWNAWQKRYPIAHNHQFFSATGIEQLVERTCNPHQHPHLRRVLSR